MQRIFPMPPNLPKPSKHATTIGKYVFPSAKPKHFLSAVTSRSQYCPGGTKRRNSQVDLSGQKTYFPIVVTCLDGFGRLGGIGKIIRIDVRRVFSSHIDEKSGKPPNSFFDFLTLVIRHRFFFFVPETLNPVFLKI